MTSSSPRPSAKLIQHGPFSRRTPLNQAQVDLWVAVVRLLHATALRLFGVEAASRLPDDAWERLIGEPDYELFVQASHGAGFVCTDFTPTDPIRWQDRSNPAPDVAAASLPQLRHWVHFLLRSEKWADGEGSPVVDALRDGRLMAVAERLARDPALRAAG
jgi:hypothetical protein